MSNEPLSIEEFKARLSGNDSEAAYEAFYHIDDTKAQDYATPADIGSFIKKISDSGHSFDGIYYDIKRFIEKIPAENQDEYRAAYIGGLRDKYEELIDAKKYQNLLFFLFDFRGDRAGWNGATEVADQVFKPEDIVKMSEIYIGMHLDGTYDPNHINYGLFSVAMSKSYGSADPFKNLRKNIPFDHVKTFTGFAQFDDCEQIIGLAACEKKFESAIPEEFFVKALADSMKRPQPNSNFWERLQASKTYKGLFAKHAPAIFQTMLDGAADPDSGFLEISRLIKFASRVKVRDVFASPAQIRTLAERVASVPGQEIKYSEIFTAVAGSGPYKKSFNAEQIAAVADRLTQFTRGEAHMEEWAGEKEYPYKLKESTDRKITAFSELVQSAVKLKLDKGIAADAFKRAAFIYECGSNMNAVWDVDSASKLRPDFRTAFVEGRLAIKNPRDGYGRAIGYDGEKDKFILEPKAA